MTTRIPIIPTIIVAAAIATMIALGFWQLDRRGEKEALIARYSSLARDSGSIPLPTTENARLENLYRPATAICERVVGQNVVGGSNRLGTTGWVQLVDCLDPDGVPFEAAVGWTVKPAVAPYSGGPINGHIGGARNGTRLISSGSEPGMMMLPRPDPRNIPNNHLAYAGQWFFFALTALVIYILALRRRGREPKPE